MEGVEDRAVVPAVDGIEDEQGLFEIDLFADDSFSPPP